MLTHVIATNLTNRTNQAGVTILELLITVSLISILLTVGVPNLTAYLATARMKADVMSYSYLLRYSRTFAMTEMEQITVCPSADYEQCASQWDLPLMAFNDRNENRKVDPAETIIATTEPLRGSHKIAVSRAVIKFFESGASAIPASVVLCPRSNENKLARAILISLQGRIRHSLDSDNDSIHNLSRARNINCQTI